MLRPVLATLLLSTAPLHADAPQVMADIPPVHSLVAQVMEGVGTPGLIVVPGASPHNYAMKPSDAAALSAAEVVVWMGPALTPWLQDPVGNLAGQARLVTLVDTEAATRLGFREGALWAEHDHDHGSGGDHAHEADHDHDDDHDHAEEAGHDHDHDHAEDAGHDHDHAEEAAHDHEKEHAHDHAGETDPHMWLDPANGAVFLTEIAETLAEIDPENAATYRANAAAGRAALDAQAEAIAAQLAPHRDAAFIVMHDGYHYFEHAFDIEARGAISDNDAQSPGAARITALRDDLGSQPLRCAFGEPQMDGGFIEVVIEGHDVSRGTLDPLGASLEPGPALYGQLLQDIADEMARCLGD